MSTTSLIIVLLIAAVLVVPYLLMRVSARRAVGMPAPDIGGLLPKGADRSRPLYFYFMSDRCSMCRAMTPVVEQLARYDANVVKVNISQHPEAAAGFRVRGTPTTMEVRDGTITRVKLGQLSESGLRRFVAG